MCTHTYKYMQYNICRRFALRSAKSDLPYQLVRLIISHTQNNFYNLYLIFIACHSVHALSNRISQSGIMNINYFNLVYTHALTEISRNSMKVALRYVLIHIQMPTFCQSTGIMCNSFTSAFNATNVRAR